VDWYNDVFEIVFPNVDVEEANSVWKTALKKPKKAKDGSEEDD
jgi:Lon-like ATP-dependent protease